MQAKLFAWTSCSVAEFMLKLPFPPPFPVVRAGITQLKVNYLLIDVSSKTNFFRILIYLINGKILWN